MGYFDYSREPRSDIAFVDMKSFYASVECVDRGLHPLKTSPINKVGALNLVVIRTSLIFGTLSTTTNPGLSIS